MQYQSLVTQEAFTTIDKYKYSKIIQKKRKHNRTNKQTSKKTLIWRRFKKSRELPTMMSLRSRFSEKFVMKKITTTLDRYWKST